MVDQHGAVIHLMNPVNVTRISIAGLVDRVFKLKVRNTINLISTYTF